MPSAFFVVRQPFASVPLAKGEHVLVWQGSHVSLQNVLLALNSHAPVSTLHVSCVYVEGLGRERERERRLCE